MRLILFISSLFIATAGWCQNSMELRLVQTDCIQKCTTTLKSSPDKIQQSLAFYKYQKLAEGYIEFSYLPNLIKEDSLVISYKLGQKYNQSELNIVLIRKDTVIETEQLNPRKLSRYDLDAEIQKELEYLENNGYPFAMLKTESHIENGQIETVIQIDRGPLILYEAIILSSDSLISTSYLQNLLEIKTGEPYSEKNIAGISRKIANDRLVRLNRSPQVIFSKSTAQVYLELSKSKSSSVNGIVGILPSLNAKTQITGEINLNLVNEFKRGEKFLLNWERLRAESQNLNISAELPYLFRSKLGIGGSITIFRQDSTVNRSSNSLALNYSVSPNFKLLAGIGRTTSNSQLDNDASYANTSLNSYFAGTEFANLDYIFNPRRGFGVNSKLSVGNRAFSTDLDNTLTEIQLEAEYFLPLFSKSTLRLAALGTTLSADSLYLNEVYYIGGINSFRGVNERSIPASSFITGTLEYRYLFEQNSNVLVFAENNWNELNLKSQYSKRSISALGIGLNIGTKSGIFSFNYALSNLEENKFLLRNAKINFGFSNTF